MLISRRCWPSSIATMARASDIFLCICLLALGVYTAVSVVSPESISFTQSMYELLLYVSLVTGYYGSFVVSVVGNASIIVPIPYMGVPYMLGGLRDPVTSEFVFDPTLVGLVSGAGAMLGEMISYGIGRLGRRLVPPSQVLDFSSFVSRHPRATPVLVFLLAATPLPDDAVMVPLGVSRYQWWKLVTPLLLGKTVLMLVVAWAGRLSLDYVGQIVGGLGTSGLVGRVVESLTILMVVVAIYALVRIEWRKY
ncbi:MAG: VTT domain-containing protein [Candidatus Thorarchaeota archaeon]